MTHVKVLTSSPQTSCPMVVSNCHRNVVITRTHPANMLSTDIEIKNDRKGEIFSGEKSFEYNEKHTATRK